MALNVISSSSSATSISMTFASTIRAFVRPSLSLRTTPFARSPSKLNLLPLPASPSSFPPLRLRSRGFHGGRVTAMSSPAPGSVNKPEEEWRAILSPEQFRILRQKGTEYPGTGEYNKLFEDGIYSCAGCGTPLYKSATKFDSGCGWPAFFDGLPGAINRTMGEESRSLVRLVGDISAMFSKEKVSLHLPMSDTV
ncbi:peptide methionine sulfoxide reductase B2, chloroplastic isoform X2 [Brassica napus]|uniref:peptide methionine sulfoxide reductase B2, chloroplastic isoform X2 n=1 Tax=Brassica napus TaxID=3708 RepID=UPI002078DAE1|nr:peptide methionine sulfoxide reductase B2, chloroplastic isoform X2 [Brassica napus]